ncbi:hypothetical protein [Blastopirellula retiformator]|uniref:Uncharacterized protein n=1 Tax=Blastopirellula retiformator TaxID=2527970 RepID=A0A5C5VL84_9BACT|nr:hypothetical protein [Blastopirellula retiformator]TWT38680.1 hypothetical protein Enr8_03730 [Blastopirellula retiformator]
MIIDDFLPHHWMVFVARRRTLDPVPPSVKLPIATGAQLDAVIESESRRRSLLLAPKNRPILGLLAATCKKIADFRQLFCRSIVTWTIYCKNSSGLPTLFLPPVFRCLENAF